MAWVPDSRTPGYLGPNSSPQPLTDDAWDNFLHDVIAGITGLDPLLVRPRWQREAPNIPEFTTDWMAFGVTETQTDFDPAVIHVDDGDGYDMLQEHEIDTITCSFYGPHAGHYCSYLRRGMYIWQNRAMLRANNVGLVDVSAFFHSPEQIRAGEWLNRSDCNVTLRREIRYNYPVMTILRAQGLIEANPPGTRVLTEEIDTGFIPDNLTE